MRKALNKYGSISAFWIVMAVINVLGIYSEIPDERREEITFVSIAFGVGARWLMWIFFTPLILWLNKRILIEIGNWRKTLSVHIPIGLFIGIAYSFVLTMIDLLGGQPFSKPFFSRFLDSLAFQVPMAFLIYLGIIGIDHALRYYHRFKEGETKNELLEKELAKSQLQSLRNQLHPHFLFNTMHTISNLIRDKSYQQAIDMIAGLSDLLRKSLDNTANQLVQLKDEIAFTNLYLDIEKVRFKDRLKIATDFQENTLHLKVPFIILQPLAENSIKHGITKHKKSGKIGISSRIERNQLILQIKDDGPGLPENWSLTTCSGVGLSNVERRLQALYNGNHRFDVSGSDGPGVTVTIILPLATERGEAQS